MKKILLGTTTLIGAAALFAGAAHADTPKVTVGGFADFQVGVVGGEDNNSGTRNQDFRSDTTLTFRVDAKTDAGLGYGGGVDLESDTSADVRGQGANASRTFVYLDGNWGRFELGSEVGAEGTMKVDAGNIARATGGINGDFWYFTNAKTQFWAKPQLALGYGFGSTAAVAGQQNGNFLGNAAQENLNKVTYYTPRFAGFQVGVSYITSNNNRGQFLDRINNGTTSTADNIFTGGLSYENTFGDVGVALSATGEAGNATSAANEDLRSWEVGGKVSYMGFSVAGSYGNTGDSLRTKALNVDDTRYWTAGGAYEYGPFGVSVTYLDSKYDTGTLAAGGKNNFRNTSIGTDYKLAPGLTPYAELDFINQDAGLAANDNTSTVFIAGTQLSF